jgi:hypothetical protein
MSFSTEEAWAAAPAFAALGRFMSPTLRIASRTPVVKCSLQCDQGDNYGNCKKTCG